MIRRRKPVQVEVKQEGVKQPEKKAKKGCGCSSRRKRKI